MAVLPHLAFFLDFIIATLAGMWPAGWSTDEQHDAAHATLEALEPRDLVEAMLAARMIATHHASLDGFARAMRPELGTAEVVRLRNNAIAAGRSFDAALRLLEKRRAPARPASTHATRGTRSAPMPSATDDPLEGFTPEEIAAAEYSLDHDPADLARNELAKRIPLERWQDMTMEERRIAYAPRALMTPAEIAVWKVRMRAAHNPPPTEQDE
jgi:hypothetical protein